MTLKGTDLAFIKKAHMDNDPKTSHCNKSSEFMNKVMYSMPLNQLYEVIASCNYDEKSNFCPVLIHIKN